MVQFKRVVSSIARFLAISLLIDLGMFLVASILCLTNLNCTGEQWSEYMFWLSMIALVAGMPAVLASLSTSRGYFDNPMTAGADMQVAGTIIQHERRELSKRTVYTLRMFSIGILGIVISAMIDFLSRPVL
jgi:hypothetical protein